MTPSIQELQSALDAIRQRPAHCYWPATLDEVLANPIQARLLRIEATLRRRRFKPQPYRTLRRSSFPAMAPVAMDRKRAAAGDIDN